MYLSADKIAAMEGEHRVHFVNPAAKRINKSLGDAAGLKNLGVHIMTVASGDRSSEYHCHRYEDEAIYVLSGHGTAVVGDDSYKDRTGRFFGFSRRWRGARNHQRQQRTASVPGDRPTPRARRCRLSACRQTPLPQQRPTRHGGYRQYPETLNFSFPPRSLVIFKLCYENPYPRCIGLTGGGQWRN